MEYIGEHTLPGQIGNFFVTLSFVGALLAGISYLFSANASDEDNRIKWKRLARTSFLVHVLSCFIFVGIVFYLLVSHYYEYAYIWEQSNSEMDFRYILVCFWGGQQGSFMLWIFWHAVLGSILLRVSKNWEAPVMAVFCMVQVFLVSMLFGVYLGDFKIGLNPFALRREVDEVYGPLWSNIPDYLQFDIHLKDGRGLNPLLQNYWMIIHPPTLFLGFGLVTIPFCYAIAGLWKKQFTEWIKPALPWTFLGITILGVGILMGGMWAYESLSFGGFWAWDPVENASLVPWIFLLGAGHLMLVNRHRKTSVYSAILLTLLAFIFVLYSTYLTRSGILGDTSVHSFTGEDMHGQLLWFLIAFVYLSFVMIILGRRERIIFSAATIIVVLIALFAKLDYNLVEDGDFKLSVKSLLSIAVIMLCVIILSISYMKHFPKPEGEEEINSREFWMFIASLVLVMSALHVIICTSLPIINNLFNFELVIDSGERNAFYNMWQIPFAIIITILVAFTQFFKYKKTEPARFFKQLSLSFVISLVLTYLMSLPFEQTRSDFRHLILLFGATFSVIANLDYYLRLMKGKPAFAGSSIAHAGFGLLILGTLISQGNQQTISRNYKGYQINFLDKEGGITNQGDVQLFLRDTVSMGDYFVVWKGKRKEGVHLFYDIDYYTRVTKTYKKGDRIRFNATVMECNADHTARENFIEEKNFWKPVSDNVTAETFFKTPMWESHQPGGKLFTLSPFVQVQKMQNVPEPGTQHFLTFDIFTHIKYADLTPVNDGEMPAITMKGKLKDTLWTAGYRIHFSEATKTGSDTIGNADQFMGARLQLKVYDHMDKQGKYPIIAEPEYLFNANGEVKNPMVELKDYGLKFRILSIDTSPDSTTNAQNDLHHIVPESKVSSTIGRDENVPVQFEVEMYTNEYLILHAIKFPFINVLWIGCVIMALGTLLAVYQRIQLNKRTKD